LGGDEAFNEGSGSSSVATLRDLLWKLRDSQYNGETLWTPKKLKSLDTWQQQDAQEYYSKILDEIDKEVTKVANIQHRPSGLEVAGVRDDTVESQHSDDSGYQSLSTLSKPGSEGRIPRNPLEGLVAQRVACVQCGHSEGLSMIPFNFITLNLGVNQGVHDLYERLDSYTDLESIEGVECAKCTLLKVQRLLNIIVSRNTDVAALKEPLSRLKAVKSALEEDDFEEETLRDKCKISKQHRVTTTKTKQMVIGRPPSSLAIHINRSVFDENTGHMLKNLAAVRFPSILDLGPWCLGSAGTSSPGLSDGPGDGDRSTKALEDAEEQWSSDPKSSMVSGDLKPSKISGPIYELRAVITHQGRHENGHYVCYRKHAGHVAKMQNGPDEEPKSLADNQRKYDQNGEGGWERGNTEEGSKWWRLSDETVWEVSEDLVLAQGGVFMLFYDCVDPNSVLILKDQGCSPLDLDDTETAEDIRALEAHRGPDAPKTDDQFHDTRSGFEVVDRPNAMTLTSEHPPCPNQADVSGADGQLEAFAESSLYPSLRQGDSVDPTIPLLWPNS
jgi:ubiquitin carboxyl-terminal hydrolase 1